MTDDRGQCRKNKIIAAQMENMQSYRCGNDCFEHIKACTYNSGPYAYGYSCIIGPWRPISIIAHIFMIDLFRNQAAEKD